MDILFRGSFFEINIIWLYEHHFLNIVFEIIPFLQSPDLFEPALHSRSSRIDRPMLGVHSLQDHAMLWPFHPETYT